MCIYIHINICILIVPCVHTRNLNIEISMFFECRYDPTYV